MTKKERFEKIIAVFQQEFTVAETELHYKNPYQLVVAVILSAQCTDKRVNLITPDFFKKFPEVYDLAKAKHEDVYELIKSCSYPNNKTRHLIGMAQSVVNEFKGTVPQSREELQKIPGIGRKTANVILAVAFDKPAMAVDTHVFRVARRLGLAVKAKTPFETEKQLVEYIPEELLSVAHHWLILHGRYVCKARKPECDTCYLTEYCKYYQSSLKKK